MLERRKWVVSDTEEQGGTSSSFPDEVTFETSRKLTHTHTHTSMRTQGATRLISPFYRWRNRGPEQTHSQVRAELGLSHISSRYVLPL